MVFFLTYLKYKEWLKIPLEESALPLLNYALEENREHQFLDFKRDFFVLRQFQKDKAKSEELTKNSISLLLERYSVAFANTKGGFLIVGIAQNKNHFELHGVNYKNINRKKLLLFLKKEEVRIKKDLNIDISFISLRINNREVFVFKIRQGKSKPYLTSLGKFFIRKKDQTMDMTKKLS